MEPIDGNVAKGLRFIFTDGRRIIFRWVGERVGFEDNLRKVCGRFEEERDQKEGDVV